MLKSSQLNQENQFFSLFLIFFQETWRNSIKINVEQHIHCMTLGNLHIGQAENFSALAHTKAQSSKIAYSDYHLCTKGSVVFNFVDLVVNSTFLHDSPISCFSRYLNSSSSNHVDNMDSLDSHMPSVPISHHSWKPSRQHLISTQCW